MPSLPSVENLLPTDRFAAAVRLASCPPEQIQRFIHAGVLLQPKQLAASAAARLCDQPHGPTAIGFGGARGGGKSFWLLAQMGVDDCQRFPGLKCLLLRKVGKSNLESFEDLRQRLFLRLPYDFNASRGLLTFANGSRIILGHFQSEKDIDKYLGLEYDVIGVEEATTLTSRKYHDIVTCCRTSKSGWRPRLYSTTNPGGVGHAWYRKMFILPYYERQRLSLAPIGGEGARRAGEGASTSSSSFPVQNPSTLFIPATIEDNSFINADYQNTLNNLTGWQKRAWRYGDWDIAAGQFFTTFRREIHVIDDFDDRRAVEWFAALDYGFTHYTVVLLACKDCDDNYFIVDEHAERLWLPQRHGAAVQAMLERHGLSLRGRGPRVEDQAKPGPFGRIKGYWLMPRELMARPKELARFVAGADVFSRQSDGTTIAAQYAREGMNLRPAYTDRVNGWAEILRRLGDPDAGIRPSLFIHRRCTRLIDCLPSLQHDPNHPEDVLKADLDEDGIGGDDPADALRYLVASKAREIQVVKLRGF